MIDAYQVIRLGTDSSGRDVLVNRRMKAAYDAAVVRLGGKSPTIVQGAYMARLGGGASQSAGYHDAGGCLDFRTWDLPSMGLTEGRVVAAFRAVGWAAWKRDMAHGGFDDHIHLVLLGDTDAASGALAQMQQYRASHDGLASNGPDYHPRPNPIPTFNYDAWTKAQAADEGDLDMDEKTLRTIVREEVHAELNRKRYADRDSAEPKKRSLVGAVLDIDTQVNRTKGN